MMNMNQNPGPVNATTCKKLKSNIIDYLLYIIFNINFSITDIKQSTTNSK